MKSTQHPIKFQQIGIVGQPRNDHTFATHLSVYHWLKENAYQVYFPTFIADKLGLPNGKSLDELGELADLIIVIGGDGNMLGMARHFARFGVPLIGINRGQLGFLTDIDPQHIFEQLPRCLEHHEFIIEERFMLDAYIERDGKIIGSHTALNEVVVHPPILTKMIEFDVFIDDKFAFTQRSDGLIISTPTGSTAYSLSAGGPILTPNMNALTLVPMFPHTLNSRPLVIDGDSQISLRFGQNVATDLELNFDSQYPLLFRPDDVIVIKKSRTPLRLLHLTNYNYFNVLRSKLGWLNTCTQ